MKAVLLSLVTSAALLVSTNSADARPPSPRVNTVNHYRSHYGNVYRGNYGSRYGWNNNSRYWRHHHHRGFGWGGRRW